mgnify:CR=1 FL=1
METKPHPVLCVDDNDYICEAIRRKLRDHPEFPFAGALPSADRLVEEVERTGAALIFLDMNMPGKDPIEAVRELSERFPGVRAIVLSGYVHEEVIDRALEAGAAGYLSKCEEPEVLMEALRRVAAGELVLSPEVMRLYARSGNMGVD